MQHGHVLKKKLNFDLLTPSPGSEGVCWHYICYHVAAFLIPFNLICNMTMFGKGWILTVWPHPRVRGSADKIFATMLLHVLFPLIWYATWPCSEKVEFWPFEPTPYVNPGGRRQAFYRKSRLICFIFIVPLSVCEISVKILTTDWVIAKFKYLTFDHTLGVRGWGKNLSLSCLSTGTG